MPKEVPTLAMITSEIEKLRTMKPNVREFTVFNDSNHDAIDAQITVLEKRMTSNEIYDRFGDDNDEEFAQNVLDDALAARAYLDGESEDGETPSESWSSLVS